MASSAALMRYGDIDPHTSGARVDAFPLVTPEMSNSFGMNFSVFKDCSIDWTVNYDEALHCVEGEIDIVIDGKSHVLGPRDSIWLPAGTSLTYRATNATVLAIYSPVNPQAT
jgi:ethanolamine utilization protein EutQ